MSDSKKPAEGNTSLDEVNRVLEAHNWGDDVPLGDSAPAPTAPQYKMDDQSTVIKSNSPALSSSVSDVIRAISSTLAEQPHEKKPPAIAPLADQHTILKAPSSQSLPPVIAKPPAPPPDALADQQTILKAPSSQSLPPVQAKAPSAPSLPTIPPTNAAGLTDAEREVKTMYKSGGSSGELKPVVVDAAAAAPAPAAAADPFAIQKKPGAKPMAAQKATDAPRSQAHSGDVQDPEEGERIHHYEVIRLIGRGGMGSVFLGRDTRLGRKVAIKFLRTQSEDLTKRFILEARTTAACSHENIVVIYEVDEWKHSPFMVFEYLSGTTLSKLIPSDKPLPATRAVELMVPVVRALAFAHSQGIVHRDLKPDNIFVTDSGITKVLDFGIAKVLQGDDPAESAARPRASGKTLDDNDDSELTQHGAMMGTMAFMAPEQWGIGVPIDSRADIWSVGIMLYRMLAGEHPLEPLRGHQLSVTGVLTAPMPTLHSKAPDVPKELADAVDKCLMKHKEQRWPDAVTLLRALEPFLPGRYTRELKIDESPYAGLSSFQETDADRFFGRQLEVAAMVNRIKERPLIGIVGPSGAGKSSFVRAGVVPALKRSGEGWESIVLRPGRTPLASLASLISPMVGSSTSVADDMSEEKKLAARFAEEPGYVGSILRNRARREKKNILLFVDQFEELYTLVPDANERRAFTACLAAVADDPTSPIRLVLSIRSDFLDRVSEDARFMAELSQGLVFLNAPGSEGLRDAILQPAEMAGYRFETPAIVDDMLKHLASTSGALPLLQFSAQKLWENRDAARKMLTQSAYAAIGGVAGALASHADAVLAKIPPASLPIVRSIFLRLVTPDRTRAIVSVEELNDIHSNKTEVQTLLATLVQARLLVVQTGSGVATYEIVHESLLHSWPMLKRWLEESGEDAAFLDQLRTAARQWQQKGRGKDLLWRGELAGEAERFSRRYRGELGDTQKQFLQAVMKQTTSEARFKRVVAYGAIVFLIGLVAASFVAIVQIQKAKGEAEEQAIAAKSAEQEARNSFKELKIKEDERAAAAAAAEKNAAQAQKAAEELRLKQQELITALSRAEEAAQQAKEAQGKAVANSVEASQAKTRAEDAKKRADKARQEVTELLDREKDRAKRLEDQLGSPVIDTLK